MNDAAATSLRPVKAWTLLAIILCAAGYLRVRAINRNSLWYDEFGSLQCSAGNGLYHQRLPHDALIEHPIRSTDLHGAPPARQVWTSLSQDQHPPLYFLMLRGWRMMFGSSDASLRAMSVSSCLVAIVLLFLAGREWFDSASALWAAALMAVATPMIDLSLQVRGYMLMLMFLCGALLALARIEKNGASFSKLVALGTCVLGAMLTHYFAIGAVLGMFIYSMIRFDRRLRFRVLACFAVAGSLFAIIWGPQFWEQRKNFSENRNYLADAPEGHSIRVLRNFALAPARLLTNPPPRTAWAAMLFSAIYVLPFALARRRPVMLLAGLWITIAIGLVALLDLWRGTAQLPVVRYTIAAAPMLYLLIAGIAPGRWIRRVLPALCIAGALLGISDAYQPYEGDWRGLSKSLNENISKDDAIVFTGGARGDYYSGWLYLGLSHYANTWPDNAVLLDHPISPEMRAELQRFPRVWLIAGPGADVDRLLNGAPVRVVHNELLVGSLYQIEVGK